MIRDLKKHFDDIQEETRQNRAERATERRRTEALEKLKDEASGKLDAILQELRKHRADRRG